MRNTLLATTDESPAPPASLRIALVLNPFTLRRKGGDHAPWVARELLGRGHAVRAFGDVIGGIPQSQLEAATEEGSAPLERAGLVRFQPDVIVAYDGLSPAAWRSARAARKLDVPLILVEEGFPDRGKPVERGLRYFGARAWGRFVRRTAVHVIALDPAAEAQAHQEGFDPGLVTVLRSGVDTTTYRPGLTSQVLYRHGVAGEVLLHIGRIEPGRGIEVLIDAFARTVGRRGDWSLVFAGVGSHRDVLRAQADRLGVGARVHWTPVPATEELPGLLGASTALLVPAIDDDVASPKIRRAMACGIPVLVSDVDRLGGMVVHDESGLVVRAGDLEAWTQAISRLSSDPKRRARWGNAARVRAKEHFSWPKIADRFEATLLGAVQERAARQSRPANQRQHQEEVTLDLSARASNESPHEGGELAAG
ncbi:D-inositol 3-phosphate glycosyltransferase [Planctomycetes bacterium Poly30]|uniref:D-inositol 3-phosphate glycosyltransferase n=1 Tax=Saltatorellus ferox TaxID=2528018 RepID=A0A518EU57_9BACT|nr:D-inositol 3-phosphate glycosyltransferase [Planctomycetes bacterium Poly30]